MVIDTSALLAVLFGEDQAAWVTEQMNAHAGTLRMSTVNLSETLIILRDRQPDSYGEIEERILLAGIRFLAPDVEQARIAAEARIRFPLNLGDCFAYALARLERAPLLTLDSDFRRTDIEVYLPSTRA